MLDMKIQSAHQPGDEPIALSDVLGREENALGERRKSSFTHGHMKVIQSGRKTQHETRDEYRTQDESPVEIEKPENQNPAQTEKR